MTFTRYVLRSRGEDSKYGDLARDVQADPAVSTRMSYTSLRARMVAYGACREALETVDEMFEMFKARRKTKGNDPGTETE